MILIRKDFSSREISNLILWLITLHLLKVPSRFDVTALDSNFSAFNSDISLCYCFQIIFILEYASLIYNKNNRKLS